MDTRAANLTLWDSIERTDPGFTQQLEKPYPHTAIDGHYFVRKATETWGPVGVGWNYDIESYFTPGHIIAVVGQTEHHKGWPVHETTHTARITVWFMHGEEKRTVQHFGHTKYVYQTKYGPTTDHEAEKKSVTDGLKKCMSMIGMCADVYLNMFSDRLYLEAAEEAAALEKADDKADMIEQQKSEFRDWVDRHRETLKTAASMHELEVVYKTVMRKLSYRGEQELMKEFEGIKNYRKSQLEGKAVDLPQTPQSAYIKASGTRKRKQASARAKKP